MLIGIVFPKHFELPMGEDEKERVLEQFGIDSKRMRKKNPQEAKDASQEVREAVSPFLSSSYQTLLKLNWDDASWRTTLPRPHCDKVAFAIVEHPIVPACQ